MLRENDELDEALDKWSVDETEPRDSVFKRFVEKEDKDDILSILHKKGVE